jgi:hypothetical protein
MTMPKPGTISFPLGTSTPLGLSFLSVPDVVVVLAGLGADVPPLDSLFTVATEVAGVSVVVVNAVMSCTITGSGGMIGAVVTWFRTLFGFVGLIGLIGDAGLFKFVDVILQVSNIVDHAVQVGEPYGSEQIETLCSCNNPSNPVEHVSVLVSVDSIHVGGFGVQLLELVVQPVQLCEVHS